MSQVNNCTSEYQTAPDELPDVAAVDNQDGETTSSSSAVVLPTVQEEEAPASFQLWQTLHAELTNVGKSLSCPLCLSTYTNPVLLPCVHAYCRDCIERALGQTPKCPTCCSKATKRSLVPAPHFSELVAGYKLLSRSLGITPIVYDPGLAGLTQLAPETPSEEESSIDSENSLPNVIVPNKNKSIHPSLVDCHEHLQVSRTWHSVCLKQSTMKTTQKEWMLQERKRVLMVNERALVQAAVRQQKQRKQQRSNGVEKAETPSRSVSFKTGQVLQEEGDHPMMSSNDTDVDKSLQHVSPTVELTIASDLATASLHQETPTNDNPTSTPKNDCNQPVQTPRTADTQKVVSTTHASFLQCSSQDLYEASMEEARDREVADRSGEMLLEEVQMNTTGSDDDISFLSPNTRVNLRKLSQEANEILETIRNDNNNKETVSHNHDDNDGIVTEILHLEKASQSLRRDLEESNVAAAMATDTSHEPMPREESFMLNETAGSQELQEILQDLPANNTSSSPNRIALQRDLAKDSNKENRTTSQKLALFSETQDHEPPAKDAAQEELASLPNSFSVGTIVQVQSRTWPGINKPGGVGRIVKVSNVNSAVLYDVAYILGGKERNVDAGFVSLLDTQQEGRPSSQQQDDVSHQTPRKKSRRIAKREQDEIPQALLEELKADGFATSNTATEKTMTKIKEEPTKSDSARKPTSSKQKDPKLKDATNVTTRKRKRKTPKKKCSPQEPRLTNKEKLALANERYNALIRQAQTNGVIHVVSSSLSERDQELLQVLTKTVRKNKVTLKVTKEFHPDTTTICVIPTQEQQPRNSDAAHVAVSKYRTLKVMRAELAGVPIVSPDWIAACIEKETVQAPTPSMLVRTLTTKTQELLDQYSECTSPKNQPSIHLGVAWIAARLYQTNKNGASNKNHVQVLPLENVSVFLCGSFEPPSPKKTDLQVLLRESGATALTSPTKAIKKLRSLHTNESVVLLCDNAKCNDRSGLLSNSGLVQAARTAMDDAKCSPRRVLVVDSTWLFDSISCGTMMNANLYQPSSPIGKELWKLGVSSHNA